MNSAPPNDVTIAYIGFFPLRLCSLCDFAFIGTHVPCWRLTMRQHPIVCLLVMTILSSAAAQEQIPLWSAGAPGFEDRKDTPEIQETFYLRNIHNPSLTVFLPPAEKATGAAVVVCPGGAHRFLTIDAEGRNPAQFFSNVGVAAFVLKYRLGSDDKSPFPVYDIEKHAREDAHRALRLIRSRAKEWKIDPNRVGILGFSAGGEVVSLAAFGSAEGIPEAADPIDRLSGRPDFLVYVYPGPLGIPDTIPRDAPPAFLCVAADDRSASRSIDRLYQKYREAGAPVEAHIFAKGGHAFGMGARSKVEAVKHWPDELVHWMTDGGLLTPTKTQ
jgi:acetyl esterase/lipase